MKPPKMPGATPSSLNPTKAQASKFRGASALSCAGRPKSWQEMRNGPKPPLPIPSCPPFHARQQTQKASRRVACVATSGFVYKQQIERQPAAASRCVPLDTKPQKIYSPAITIPRQKTEPASHLCAPPTDPHAIDLARP